MPRKPRAEAAADPPTDLAAVATSGDRGDTLRALRDYLAASLTHDTPLRERAPIAARLADVLAQIDALPDKREVSAADEIAARRAKRRAGSPGKARAQRSG